MSLLWLQDFTERGPVTMNKQTREAAADEPEAQGGSAAEDKAQTLRKELDVLLDELKARGRRAFDVSYQIRQHPAIIAGLGALLVGGVAMAITSAQRRRREERSLAARLTGIAAILAGQMPRGARPKVVVKRGGADYGPLAKAALGLLLPKLLPLIAGKLFQQPRALPAERRRSRP
jgi:hypothetical protein